MNTSSANRTVLYIQNIISGTLLYIQDGNP